MARPCAISDELMGKTERLKARLLREAVEENIAAMNDLVPKPLRRGRRFAALWGPRSAAGLFFLVLVNGLRLVPGIGTAAAGSTAVPYDRVAPSQRASVAPLEPAPAASFPRPRPLSLSALALGVRRVRLKLGAQRLPLA